MHWPVACAACQRPHQACSAAAGPALRAACATHTPCRVNPALPPARAAPQRWPRPHPTGGGWHHLACGRPMDRSPSLPRRGSMQSLPQGTRPGAHAAPHACMLAGRAAHQQPAPVRPSPLAQPHLEGGGQTNVRRAHLLSGLRVAHHVQQPAGPAVRAHQPLQRAQPRCGLPHGRLADAGLHHAILWPWVGKGGVGVRCRGVAVAATSHQTARWPCRALGCGMLWRRPPLHGASVGWWAACVQPACTATSHRPPPMRTPPPQCGSTTTPTPPRLRPPRPPSLPPPQAPHPTHLARGALAERAVYEAQHTLQGRG